jgi:WXG100 family type VII secretion target
MAIEGIKISLAEVSKSASVIRSLNTNLSQRLEEIKSQINGLSNSWQSDAASTLLENFNKLAPRFEDYAAVVDAYARFLDNTVTAYNSTEQIVLNNASAFK